MSIGSIWRIYGTAVATFLIGGSNALFGAHLSSVAITGDFSLGVALILAEIIAIRKRDWKTVIADLEKLAPVISDFVKQIRAGLDKEQSPASTGGNGKGPVK